MEPGVFIGGRALGVEGREEPNSAGTKEESREQSEKKIIG